MRRPVESAPSHESEARPKNRVAILDAGAQYGKVIDRRVRDLMVRSDLLPFDAPGELLEGYGAIIISGGPESVYDPEAPRIDPSILESGKPILGICYGMQLINQAFGGSVEPGGTNGPSTIEINPSVPFFEGLEVSQDVLMTHGDSVAQVAPGFRVVASANGTIAAIADERRRIYGVQFHPEVDLTAGGKDMLANFLFKVAELEADYPLEDRLEEAIGYIRETAGDRQVLVFASGGVDSTVCSMMVGMALPPEQVNIVHIDTGFMRHQESSAVGQALASLGIEVGTVSAGEQFLAATTTFKGQGTPPLCKVTDPEMKRSIIGDTFIRTMGDIIEDLGLDPESTMLAQGTLRPDLIESASHLASSRAAVIKTHHNDTQLVRELREAGQVIEPLQQLHKDEVRRLGAMLGLPEEFIWRQPFPGPGLAIRLLCAEKPYLGEESGLINEALAEFEERDIAAHLLPVRTVGLRGDSRSYSHLVGLSGAQDWGRLAAKAREIPKRISDVNRVVYVFGDKLEEPPQEITPTFLTAGAIGQLRVADWHVNEVLRKYGLLRSLGQVPVVSFPVHFGRPGSRSIGIRTFMTEDYMTGLPAIPGRDIPEEAVEEMVERLLGIPNVSRVAYDLTSKPPGTTEWE